MNSIIIFGAGIAGLSAAHELIDLGYDISVYEALDQPGGFFRSARSLDNNMPTEYSWHGMGPWYHNTFDLMRKIPFNDNQQLYDAVLSHPIDFGIFPDDAHARFYDEGLKSIPGMFRMSKWEAAKWAYLMLKTWTSHRRSEEQFSKLNAAQMWRPLLKDTAYRTWRSCFGPWIGSDWKKASLHTTGEFFKKQLTTKPEHLHKADDSGPAWTHSAGDGWLLLKGPSSEYWFNPWVKYLSQKGVRFFWEKPLTRLDFDGTQIVSALAGGEKVVADAYVIAINPFIMAEVLGRTPELEQLEVLNLFKPLTMDGPHTQVSFRLAFPDKINFPRQSVGVVVCDSEFNLTLFAQEQVWDKGVDLGKGIQSLWTGTSCCSSAPGRIYNKPVEKCTKEEFVEEIKAQIFSCGALDEMIRDANNGKPLMAFSNVKIEIWHEWEFSSNGIKHFQPKWVTTQNTQAYMPSQKTPVANLFLAGSHTAIQADVWSIEGAVESGRRAANAIDRRVEVIDQHRPGWLHLFSRIDDMLYKYKGPQIVDFTIMLSALLVLVILFVKLI